MAAVVDLTREQVDALCDLWSVGRNGGIAAMNRGRREAEGGSPVGGLMADLTIRASRITVFAVETRAGRPNAHAQLALEVRLAMADLMGCAFQLVDEGLIESFTEPEVPA